MLRGYGVEAVVIIDSEDGLNNADAVRAHLPRDIVLVSLPALPAASGAPASAGKRVPPHVARWLDACAPQFRVLARALQQAHARRVSAFAVMPSQARAKLWWPFTQHDDVRDADVSVVDGRFGDALLVHHASEVCVLFTFAPFGHLLTHPYRQTSPRSLTPAAAGGHKVSLLPCSRS